MTGAEEATITTHAQGIKAKVAMAAFRGDKTFAAVADHVDASANQIHDWKKPLLEKGAQLFRASQPGGGAAEAMIPGLSVKHGELAMNRTL